MLGIIVTGHGHFAKGLVHAGRMIAGDLEHVVSIVFEENQSLQAYQDSLGSAISQAHAKYGGLLVLTDLKGGTPFNTAVIQSVNFDNIAVMTGANLPMLIEGAMLAQFSEDAHALGQQLIEVGRLGVDLPVLGSASENSEDMTPDEEGI